MGVRFLLVRVLTTINSMQDMTHLVISCLGDFTPVGISTLPYRHVAICIVQI